MPVTFLTNEDEQRLNERLDALEKKGGGGTAAPYYVDMTLSGANYTLVPFDWNELLEQIHNGSLVVCRITENKAVSYFYLCDKYIDEYDSGVTFFAISGKWYSEVAIFSDGTIKETTERINNADDALGDIATAIDAIIAIQEELIGV